MAEKTGIAWTDATFNPWIGCTKVSPGCDNCYAEALDKRHRWGGAEHWGPGVPRMRTSDANWNKPFRWNRLAIAGLLPDGKTPSGGRSPLVFCASLADVFDNAVPEAWRAELWTLIDLTPALTWLLLTKRIGNARHMMPKQVLPNVWLGASIVNQEEADRDLPKLLRTPAAKRFVSYEPALGPVDLANVPRHDPEHPHPKKYDLADLDWIIVGGESRQGKDPARPFVIGWARDVLRQCREHGVAFLMKQFGSNATNREGVRHPFKDRAGADPAEWPEDLRVQEFPS